MFNLPWSLEILQRNASVCAILSLSSKTLKASAFISAIAIDMALLSRSLQDCMYITARDVGSPYIGTSKKLRTVAIWILRGSSVAERAYYSV